MKIIGFIDINVFKLDVPSNYGGLIVNRGFSAILPRVLSLSAEFFFFFFFFNNLVFGR